MGTALPRRMTNAAIELYYSETAWTEGPAEDQLNHVARMAGVRKVAAFPDLHPGKYGPVGCAVLSENIHPHLIGLDIGCGMSLFRLDLSARRVKLDKAAERLRRLHGAWAGDAAARLAAADLPTDAVLSLGTIGGGNHFCELQQVVEADPIAGLTKGGTCLLVHSGSRGVGASVFAAALAGDTTLPPQSEAAQRYIASHDIAVRWAALNRQVIAERAAEALRTDYALIADTPHNLVTAWGEGWLHRKGAARADALTPLAGSRGADSFVLTPISGADGLGSLSHGAGRRYNRSSMPGRVGAAKSDLRKLTRPATGRRVICEDKKLLIEEAPQAYKNPEDVVADLHHFGLAEQVARLRPLITYKTAKGGQK